MSPKKPQDQSLSGDLLHGIEAIAAYLGMTTRAAEHQIKKGNIPICRMGRLVVGSKSRLREHFTSGGAKGGGDGDGGSVAA